MKDRIIYPALFFLTFLLNNASAQTESDTIASDPVKLHLIETTDGNQYIGEIAKSPVVTISGMTRIGKKGYLISENYYIPTKPYLLLLSFGGRSIINKIGLDYGLFIPVSEDIGTLIAIPWL